MPPKPRPHAKRKPPPPPPGTATRPPAWLFAVATVGVVGVIAVIAIAALGVGSGGGPGDARAALETAGCTLQDTKALPGEHSVTTPNGTSEKWNTVPPTSGPHYAQSAIWGAYDDPVNMAQLVHNLEHGGIYILYGSGVPPTTVAELKSFYDAHKRGTVLAPLASLGERIALGAWTTKSASDAADGTAHLATCTTFADAAYSAFFDAYQFRGPERFPADSLLPGAA